MWTGENDANIKTEKKKISIFENIWIRLRVDRASGLLSVVSL